MFNATSGSSVMNFTLINQGSQKLWNYDEFELLVTYDANILGTRTTVTEQFTYNASASEESTGQAITVADFKVQRGELIMAVDETVSTITEGPAADFDQCVGDCFIKLVNSRLSGNGGTFGGNDNEADEVTTYITDDIGLRSAGLDVEFTRHATEGDTRDNRLQWEIWEYIGKNETGNQMIVWDTGTCTYTGANTICDGASIPEFSGDDEKVVVYITGQANPNNGLGQYPRCFSTSEWLESSNIPRFTRMPAPSNICDLSYAVVEFAGNNWDVQRIEHSFTSDTFQTETISDVGEIEQAFFHHQQRTDDTGATDDPADIGAEVQLHNSTTIGYGLPQNTGGWGPLMQSVTWVVSNSNAYSPEQMIVEHFNSNRQAGGGEEVNWQIPIRPLTYDTSETALAGLTAQTSSGGNDFPRGFFSAILTDSTTVDLYQADDDHTLEYTLQVVQFPRSQQCTGGVTWIIEAGEWTINCNMHDDFEPGILNPNEELEAMLKLEHPIFTNGFVQISISSDNGNSATKTTNAI